MRIRCRVVTLPLKMPNQSEREEEKMKQKIREKSMMLEVLEALESRLADITGWTEDARDNANLTPDENGIISKWEQNQYDDAIAKLAAIETVRGVLAKLV